MADLLDELVGKSGTDVFQHLDDIKRSALEDSQKRLQEENEKAGIKKIVKKPKRLPPKPDSLITVVGKGFELSRRDLLLPLSFPDSFRSGMMWVFGTTRSGKTRLAEGIIEQDIRKGYNLAVIDPKGDIGLFAKIAQVAYEEGRIEDLMLVTPIFPDLSAIIDPLASYYMPEELVAHIVSGVSAGDDPYYWNVSYEMASSIVQGLIVLSIANGRPPVFNLKQVEEYVSHQGLTRLKNELQKIKSQTIKVGDTIRTLERILDTPPDFFSKVGSSLRVALSELTIGSVGRIIGQADENRFLRRLEAGKGVIMVVQTGALLAQRASYTAGKVILSMIQTYVGRVLASGRKLNPPLALHIDEAHSVVYPGFKELMAKAGGANCYVTGYNQSVSQLYDEIGEDAANSILDNANTKMYLRVPDALTANFISKHLGETDAWVPMISFGGGLTIRQMEEVQVKPSEIMGLEPRQFYLQTYSGIYKGKTLDIVDAKLKLKFPEPDVIRKMR